jgi:hypothetical protein
MTPTCPVCQGILVNTTDNIWSCNPKKIRFSNLNTVLEMSHCNLIMQDGKYTYQYLVSGEYSFKIWDDDKQRKTKISTIKKVEKKHYHSKVKEYAWQEIVEISAVLSLPWHSPKKVADRVRTYIVFS